MLDSFHALVRETDLRAIHAIPGDRIFLVQMADAPWVEMDYLSWSRHLRCFPGQGHLPVEAFADALGATGFDGLLSLEIFSDRFRAGSARQVAIDGRRSLIVLLDELRTRRPDLPDGPTLPPRATCGGVEFVEFAVSPAERPDFEAKLEMLGFARVGRHRSKDVVRWTQGDINIVVNADASGFAHSYYLAHGAAVCAIALRVDDANAAVERATALLDAPFRQAIGPGELDIPAVRGLGGSLVYFVDRKSGLNRLWDVDFMPIPGGNLARSAGLTRIDHIQQAMRYEEMLSWVLFYTSLLQIGATPVVDVVDPGGLVQSQALATHDGSLRLALNATQSHQTRAARFLGERFGAGFHHIAFATHDILATAARLGEAGLQLLPIPENYYDDLEARTDLTRSDVAPLRQNGILYDQDASGEFFQLYTFDMLGRAFFFEVVERRNGYTGFGAANAPIRLAAQTHLGVRDRPSP